MYTGHRGDYDLLCEECAGLDDPRSQLATVCVGCTGQADERSVSRISGQPEVRRHDRPLTGILHEEPVLVEPANDRCLVASGDGWLVYTGLQVVRLGGPSYEVTLPEDEEEDDSFGTPGPTLHASSDGRFVAVVWDYGRYGAVVDLTDGRVTLQLDRQDYCNFATPFPFAFLSDGTVVAATDWNRLDRFDTATGELLTPRDTEQREGEEQALDYFHGRLTVSPTGAWLLDDGWAWHPVGVPVIVALAAWREGETYAAEQGRELTYRDAWSQPVAWVSDRVVALQGIGLAEQPVVEGVQLYDAPSGDRLGEVFGLKGQMWGVDGRLAVAAEGGLEFWDPAEDARVGVLPGYRPTAYNPQTRTFAALDDGVLRTYRLTEPGAVAL
ncbi:hypothetical protein [Kribbella albertanoniae]|uniref:WG repeat-containing protein n=1 Tax=Kribbella albertanoniae TaxID=1266829 RepID=A0A4R4PKJ2_9ACTN|nr:hypothetical protein [Kribbella albertanoniae]TDC22607.1 hypothetical protein E1261_30485 [Kribbella albertanoniae]